MSVKSQSLLSIVLLPELQLVVVVMQVIMVKLLLSLCFFLNNQYVPTRLINPFVIHIMLIKFKLFLTQACRLFIEISITNVQKKIID